MPLVSRKIPAFSKRVSDLADRPGGTIPPAQLKAQFDSSPEELRVALNGIVDDIIAEYALRSELDGLVLGLIPDGTLTQAKLSKDVRTKQLYRVVW